MNRMDDQSSDWLEQQWEERRVTLNSVIPSPSNIPLTVLSLLLITSLLH